MTASASSLELKNVSFAYGSTSVLTDVSTFVESGSLYALLGPSGSGKSTLLSIVAGLLAPDRGQVLLDGADIVPLPPESRGLGVVFQSYALFPNMTAGDNIAFGLRRRGFNRTDARDQAQSIAERLGLADFMERRPHELSGGQQQRVALARAVAARPRLLLLDEPLSNIDPALRTQVRVQLREWLAQWNITTVLVTHDREDAFWLADRIGLLRDGALVQEGEPTDVYQRPVDEAAAEMLGPINRIPLSDDSWALVRPEATGFATSATVDAMPATVRQVVHLGAEIRLLCQLDAGSSVWVGQADASAGVGTNGFVVLPREPWIVHA